jgi:hypothetical protein
LKKVLTNGAECGKIIEQKEEELSVLTVSQGEYGMILRPLPSRIMCAVYTEACVIVRGGKLFRMIFLLL